MRCWLLALTLVACRDPAPVVVADAAPSSSSSSSSAALVARVVDAGLDVKLPLDPACDGLTLELLEAARDPRCAVSVSEWDELRTGRGLRQEAQRDGQRIIFSIVNRGPAALIVPVRFDDRAPERVFTATAQVEGDAPGLFVLAPPHPELSVNDAGIHVHNARIRLPPGGRASVRLTIDSRVTERLDRRGADAGTLRGPVVLHLGQAFSPIEAGDPARVSWEPLR